VTMVSTTTPYTTFSVRLCLLAALSVVSAALMRPAFSVASACVRAMGWIMLFHGPIDKATRENAGDDQDHKASFKFGNFVFGVQMKLLDFGRHCGELLRFFVFAFFDLPWGFETSTLNAIPDP